MLATKPNIYVSSVVRHTTDVRKHGSIRRIDWGSKTILNSVDEVFPWQFCMRSANPRGGLRGWNGILVGDREVVVANNDALVFYSKDFAQVKKVITHPTIASIHGISYSNGQIYLASTINDTYVVIDSFMNMKFYPLLEDQSVLDVIGPWLKLRGRDPKKLDYKKEYRAEWEEDVIHLNYIMKTLDGKTLALFNSMNMLIQISPTVEILWAPALSWGGWDPPEGEEGLQCPHDLLELPNGDLLINSSADGTLYRFEINSRKLFPIWRRPNKDDYGWVRGLDVVGNTAFVGTGTGKVLEIDLITGILVSEMKVVEDWNGFPHTIFGIAHEAGLQRFF